MSAKKKIDESAGFNYRKKHYGNWYRRIIVCAPLNTNLIKSIYKTNSWPQIPSRHIWFLKVVAIMLLLWISTVSNLNEALSWALFEKYKLDNQAWLRLEDTPPSQICTYMNSNVVVISQIHKLHFIPTIDNDYHCVNSNFKKLTFNTHQWICQVIYKPIVTILVGQWSSTQKVIAGVNLICHPNKRIDGVIWWNTAIVIQMSCACC